MQDQGFHVWWDEGISPGLGWHEEVASSIKNCSLFIFLYSEHTADSTHCKNELDYAEREDVDFVAIHLTTEKLSAGLALSLGRKQANEGPTVGGPQGVIAPDRGWTP